MKFLICRRPKVLLFVFFVFFTLMAILQMQWLEGVPGKHTNNLKRNGRSRKANENHEGFEARESLLHINQPKVEATRTASMLARNVVIRGAEIWPDGGTRLADNRILKQLHFAKEMAKNRYHKRKMKTILLYFGAGEEKLKQKQFFEDECDINQCRLIERRHLHGQPISTVDAVLFHVGIHLMNERWDKLPIKRSPSQVWILRMAESPFHIPPGALDALKHEINWTISYRADSTIVNPYGNIIPNFDQKMPEESVRNYAAGKTKLVAWFVSNCGSYNGRHAYVKELSKYIQVDIYGLCGRHKCHRNHPDKCFAMLNKNYKFYIAFENSNCKDYITEKFFLNGLMNDIVPVVMGGASKGDYDRVAPPDSFIYADDFQSPQSLAAYLHLLNNDDEKYNKYLRWKGAWTSRDTKMWCRLCALLHAPNHPTWYKNVKQWWSGPGVCPQAKYSDD